MRSYGVLTQTYIQAIRSRGFCIYRLFLRVGCSAITDSPTKVMLELLKSNDAVLKQKSLNCEKNG